MPAANGLRYDFSFFLRNLFAGFTRVRHQIWRLITGKTLPETSFKGRTEGFNMPYQEHPITTTRSIWCSRKIFVLGRTRA